MGLIESITLQEAVGQYQNSIKPKDNQDQIHKELFRFAHWCGRDRVLSGLSPAEIGEYADKVEGAGTTPLAAERLQVVRKFLSYASRKGLTERNLAKHVRIRKSKARLGKGVGETQDVVELTADGHAKLTAELERLRAERGPLAQQIHRAAADRDVRENAPLEAAREQLGHVESRIRSIETALMSAVIVGAPSGRRALTVRVGTRVSVKDLNTGRETKLTLVGRAEADPLEGKISDVSPLGQALVGRSASQEVEADTPRGRVRYRITKVTR